MGAITVLIWYLLVPPEWEGNQIVWDEILLDTQRIQWVIGDNHDFDVGRFCYALLST